MELVAVMNFFKKQCQMDNLLTRDEFREGVFKRDAHKCVVCKNPAQDAHHIIERRLFPDGGYYIDNGASLCSIHHIQAEQTVLSCETLRELAGIKKPVLPPHFYSDVRYDKWGNVYIRNNSQRCAGELFYDESVQKILNSVQQEVPFTHYVKYPRTYHLPFSEGVNRDDRVLEDCSIFVGKKVVVTEKMDGENCSIYKDFIHARSLDGRDHWSRSWVKNLQAQIGYELDDGWRICGENLFAKHSIGYSSLESYFYAFSIWNEFNECLSWDDTVLYCNLLNLITVPVLYRGVWDENLIKGLYSQDKREKMEGFVVRSVEKFSYFEFGKNVAKFVRKEHVGTSHHWMFNSVEKNQLSCNL